MKLSAKLFFATAGLVAVAAVLIVPKLRARADPAVTAEDAAGKKAKPPGTAKPAPPLRVNALRVQPAPFTETLVATGTLRADESVDLQAEVSGKIVAINFTEGRRVKKGDLLIKLNDADLVAQLNQANARRELARIRRDRFSVLATAGGINQQDLDTVESELAVQQAAVDLITAQIAKTELRAPFDGLVGLRFVSEGAYITATSNNAVRIATLQNIDNLKVDFSVSEKYASRIRLGSPVTFSVAGYEQPFRGEVYAFEPRIDVGTRTLLIRALCPNTAGTLVPGSFVTVDLSLDQIPDAILVPATAVIPGLSEKNVFVARDGKALRRPVQTGTRTESAVQILSGLQPGDVLITSGLQQLRAGQAVNPILPGETKAKSPRTGGGTAAAAAQ